MSILKKSIKTTLILIGLLLSVQYQAQEYAYKHYTVEDGLPSSQVYSAFQDSKGYIWFATDAGVSRFNGYEFENFDAADGLTDNTVFLITEDHKERIWFGTFNLKLSYYDYSNDSIYPYKYNDKIMKDIKVNYTIQNFAVDSNDNVWLGYYYNGIYKISPKGEITQMIDSLMKTDYEYKHIDTSGISISGYLRKKTKKSIAKAYNNSRHWIETSLQLIDAKKHLSVKFKNKAHTPSPSSIQSLKHAKGYLLSYYNKFLFYNEGKGSVELKNDLFLNREITSIFSSDHLLWISTRKNGIYQCKIDKDSLLILNNFLKEVSVSRVFKDEEGGYWFMTLTEGVYYLSSNKISHNDLEKGNVILSLEVDTNMGDLFLGFSNGMVSKYLNYPEENKPNIIMNFSTACPSLLYDYVNNSLLMGVSDSSDRLPFYKKGEISYIKSIGTAGFKSMILDQGSLYAAGSFGVSLYENLDSLIFSFFDGQEQIWCTSLIKNGGSIWVGTNEGIRIYEDKKIKAPFSNHKQLSTAITSLERLTEKLFLVGTKSFGLLVVKNDRVVHTIDKTNGLKDNLVKCIHVDNQKTIWVGTKNGISRIYYHGENDYESYNLTTKHGLISGETTSIKSYKNTIYAVSPRGLIHFDKTKININKTPPPVYITQFGANSEEKEIKADIELTHKENYININYEALNYRSLGEIEYQYRMLGIDTNWVTTTTRSIQYPILPPNTYTFEVKAKNEDDLWSNPSTVEFTINPPFWLTWWFITLGIGLLLFVIYLVFKYREKQLLLKSSAEKKIVELELKALRSQMNPHFIFNTLNSIQYYITDNDFKNSSKYLAQFAKLIRTVLNLSEKSVITIQEEIDMLSIYMDIEKIRFEDNFNYEIKVSDKIDIAYDEIPSMLIQPYVENAIWHGLMNKNEKGKIKIGIDLVEDHLAFVIEDNGIGREKAAEIKAKRNITRKSVGMSITKERLELISDNKINVTIVDLKDPNGKPLGTKIHLKIPYSNELNAIAKI